MLCSKALEISRSCCLFFCRNLQLEETTPTLSDFGKREIEATHEVSKMINVIRMIDVKRSRYPGQRPEKGKNKASKAAWTGTEKGRHERCWVGGSALWKAGVRGGEQVEEDFVRFGGR